MSKNTSDTSEVKQAAEHANVEQIEKNLDNRKPIEKPAVLTDDETTPFIDEENRTDR